MGFKATEEQKRIFHFIKNRKENLLIQALAGCGKCLGIDTPILMYDGTIKNVQDIKIGDYLMGDDSKPRKVLNTNKNIGELYKIIPTKGDSWVCNDVHILTVYHEYRKKIIDIPLNEIDVPKYINGNYRYLRLQKTSVDFNKKEKNIIDPYLIGLWLGDGHKENGSPIITVSSKENEIIEYLKNIKYDGITTKISSDKRNKNVLRIALTTENYSNSKNLLREEFKKCINLNNDKYISHSLLTSSYSDRLKLFAGLIDSDGYNHGNTYEIITKYDSLKRDILFLTRSLGFGSYAYIKKVKVGDKYNKYWRISISGSFEDVPVLVKRKKIELRKQIKSPLRNGFKAVSIGVGDYYGFTLDGNGRFLLGDFTITHNTTTVVRGSELLPKDSKKIYLAFNKHIQMELKQKLPEDVFCYTFHGLGMSAIKNTYGDSIKFDEFKVDTIIKKKAAKWNLGSELVNKGDQIDYLNKIKKFVNLCRQTVTLDKKYLPHISTKYDIELDDPKDHKRVFSVLEEMVNDRRTFDFTDMIFLPAIDNKIWTYQYDYVIVDEIQDLNRAQQYILKKIMKKDRVTKKVTGRLIAVGDNHQCQPEGTKILMSDGSEKNIEDVKVGDLVVSYNRKEKGHFVGKYERKVSDWLKDKAPKIEEISKRPINSNIIKINSNGRLSSYTSNHKAMVKFKNESLNKYCLYIMRKGGLFRIGIVKLWNGKNDFATFRARQENADDFWILNTYNNKFDAYTDEQYYSLEYKIPQVIFNYRNQKVGNIDQLYIDNFYGKLNKEDLLHNTINLLELFNRDFRYPFWSKDSSNYFSRNHMFELHACNILEKDMQMIHFDESNMSVRTHGKSKSTNRIIRPTYHNIDTLSYEFYSGYVYSLKISKYELYVADGILTHNSIYGFSGVSDKSFEWFEKFPNIKKLPLTITFRCAKEIVKEAQKIVPAIQALPDAPDGLVREGSVLDEPESGDFVLCRTTTPLIKLFFHYLLQGKKAMIKGSEIGVSLIEMIQGHKTIGQLMAHYQNKLKEYQISLRKRGILNYEDDNGYVMLSDNVMALEFMSGLSTDIGDLTKKVGKIFSDELFGIVLSTVHKSKGLEADRVFIARPDKMPLPTKKAWLYAQEMNLKYVAITRSRRELIYDHTWKDDDQEGEITN